MARPRKSRSANQKTTTVESGLLSFDILTVLSFSADPVGLTDLLGQLKAADVRNPKGRVLNQEELLTLLMPNIENGLVHAIADEWNRNRFSYMLRRDAIFEVLLRAQASGRLSNVYDPFIANRPPWRWRSRQYEDDALTLRVLLAQGDLSRARAVIDDMAEFEYGKRAMGETLAATLGTNPQPQWMPLLGEYAAPYAGLILDEADRGLVKVGDAILEQACDGTPTTRLKATRYLAMRGELGAYEGRLQIGGAKKHALGFLKSFWQGDYAETVRIATEWLSASRSKKARLPGLEGLFLDLARVAESSRDPAAWGAFCRNVNDAAAPKDVVPAAYSMLREFQKAVADGHSPQKFQHHTWDFDGAHWLVPFVAGLATAWSGVPSPAHLQRTLGLLVKKARGFGFVLLARELEAITRVSTKAPAPKGRLVSAFRKRAPWELAVETLGAIAGGAGTGREAASDDKHLVWQVNVGKGWTELTARVRSGRAKKGKVVSIGNLTQGNHDYLRDQDRRVLAFAVSETSIYGRPLGRFTLSQAAVMGLVGHPHVVNAAFEPVVVRRGEAGLRVAQNKGHSVVTVDPPELAEANVVVKEGDGQLTVYERGSTLENIFKAIGKKPLRVPKEGRPQLMKAVGALSAQLPIAASADVRGQQAKREADTTPVAALDWSGSSLTAELFAAPLGLSGPMLTAGSGRKQVAGEVDGELVVTERDLVAEDQRAQEVLDRCPALANLGCIVGRYTAPDLETALDVLLDLGQCGDAVRLVWPKGRSLAIPTRKDITDIRVSVGSADQWLEVGVDLAIDDGQVMGFAEILKRRRGKRFVMLDGDKFVALTENLGKRLDHLESLGRVDRKGLKTSVAALGVVDDLCADAGQIQHDKKITKHLQRWRDVAELKPRLPRGFAATLRDYQRDGFVWMARLAELGLGACLADDMGLGKTIQALTVLCTRARLGPALVVAPASVVHNWRREIERFAPSLSPIQLGDANRQDTFAALKSRDVLLCSYGLLVSEQEPLQGIEFSTVVFDEAHALKNAATKRAQAAFGLRAGFRIALTGTPVENHLGELWSLMHATIPGLLGTRNHFDRRFAGPLADGNRERAGQLRAIVRPFMLRRTKAQVLDELPPCEDITVTVTPTKEEAAFYEALRRNAVEQLAVVGDKKARFQILAELTRLRQAAVDPRLVDEKHGPAGAKLDVLVERLTALRSEGHRALVFSQFLGGMALIHKRLDEAGFEYLSLDGSTPIAKRAELIERFQNGFADVFVMSLKAGGQGVNLTGADYVIHLDPWWNPAVEEQATGRAHRMGQQRPVTVYRFVTQGTVEERILALHGTKREMADDLLAGLDTAKALNLEELQQLLEA